VHGGSEGEGGGGEWRGGIGSGKELARPPSEGCKEPLV
jgi:hypothetical protein